MKEQNLTGYPSIDKPWLKYYSEEAINGNLPECTMYEYLQENNASRLDNIALNYFGYKVTFREMFNEIEEVAKAFVGLGVKEGDTVTILSITLPEVVYSLYALNRIGAVANIVDPRTNFERVEKYIDDTKSKHIILLNNFAEKMSGLGQRKDLKAIITVSANTSMPLCMKTAYTIKTGKEQHLQGAMNWKEFLGKKITSDLPHTTYKKQSMVAIVYTGGTTGVPKGVMLTNETFNTVAYQCKHLSFTYEDNRAFLNIMPPFIAYGVVFGLNMPLTLGLTNVIIPIFKPEKFDKLIIKHRPFAIMGVPSHYEMLLKSKKLQKQNLSFIELAGAGGDAMSGKTETAVNLFFREHHNKYNVANGYGMTEVGSGVVSSHGAVNRFGSVGVPHCKTMVSIFKPGTDEELPYNTEGEVCLCTPAMMLGYYCNESETANVLRKHSDGQVWVHTNDIGYMDEDGFLFIRGRIKRMIIRPDGHNVFPATIEAVINSFDAVETCAVIGVEDNTSDSGQWAYAFVVLKDKYKGDQEVIQEIRKYCDLKLPLRDTAQYFSEIDEITLTSIGKVDYRRLENMAKELVKREV